MSKGKMENVCLVVFTSLGGRRRRFRSFRQPCQARARAIRICSIPSDSRVIEAGFDLGSLEGRIKGAGSGSSGGSLWFDIGLGEAGVERINH